MRWIPEARLVNTVKVERSQSVRINGRSLDLPQGAELRLGQTDGGDLYGQFLVGTTVVFNGPIEDMSVRLLGTVFDDYRVLISEAIERGVSTCKLWHEYRRAGRPIPEEVLFAADDRSLRRW